MAVANEGPEPSAYPSSTDPLLDQCQHSLGHWFRDLNHLKASLVHASGADSRLASNERLEFLGDAILGAVICALLYERYPLRATKLSKERADAVTELGKAEELWLELSAEYEEAMAS